MRYEMDHGLVFQQMHYRDHVLPVPSGWGRVVSNTLLALGLLLAPATQLRAENSPVGPGEVCLTAWIILELARETARLGPAMTPALKRLILFWVLFALIQSLGALMGLAAEEVRDPGSALHDTIAYLFVAATSCIAVALPQAARRLRQITWILVVLGNMFLAIQLAEAWGLLKVFDTDPYEWNRLRGWSDNSNGLALVCAALVALPLHLVETAVRTGERLLAPTFALLPVLVGLLTRSDAFILFLLTAGPLFVALKLWNSLRSLEQGLTFRGAFACIILLATPGVLAAAAPFAPLTVTLVEEQATAMYDDNGQGEDRLRLWGEAIRRGMQSGMIGFGPGAHIIDSKLKRQPPPNFEAHNTILDLFTQGGLLIVMLFVCFIVSSLRDSYTYGWCSLFALIFGLFVFGSFHLIVRHPIFWFAIALCLVFREELPSP